MLTSSFDYSYPDSLIATKPQVESRILLNREGKNSEISKKILMESLFAPEDLLIINDTKVEKRRVMTEQGLEVLFVRPIDELHWDVLFPLSKMKGNILNLPGDVRLTLVQKGLPQKVSLSKPLSEEYFFEHGVMALPPYIQKMRQKSSQVFDGDEEDYQTEWAQKIGSCAAPTASLHFSNQDLNFLKERGVGVQTLTLHVGLGTFLPVKSETLSEHKMHEELVFLPQNTLNRIEKTKESGGRVWALGTTVTRSLESWAQGKLQVNDQGAFGATDLFIYPGFEFKVVDGLLTNFHQPKSTLLALVSAFTHRENVLEAYQWSIDREFRLFSYGDLSVWLP